MEPSTDPGNMYVEESGTPGSPAILFLHGLGQSSREWREHRCRPCPSGVGASETTHAAGQDRGGSSLAPGVSG